MFKILLIAGIFFFVLNLKSFAMMCGEHSKHNINTAQAETEPKTEAVNVGNKICPVSGENVGQDGMEITTYEYKGKVYNFCCTACIEEFKKDPEKYIKKAEEEMQGKENKAATGIPDIR
jgi:YHS domain-containing protein